MTKKLTNDYENPELVTCGWNFLSELRSLYSLKSNTPLEVNKSIVLFPHHLAPNFLLRIKIIL